MDQPGRTVDLGAPVSETGHDSAHLGTRLYARILDSWIEVAPISRTLSN